MRRDNVERSVHITCAEARRVIDMLRDEDNIPLVDALREGLRMVENNPSMTACVEVWVEK